MPSKPSPAARGPRGAAYARTRFLAWLGLAGVVQFILCLLALHAASMPAIPWRMSEFALSAHPWLWFAGAYSLAVGGIALTLAVRPHLPDSWFARIALSLLWLSSCGAVLVATFPTDGTPHPVTLAGSIHNGAVVPTFTSLGFAMILIGPPLRTHRHWRAFADASMVFGLLMAAGQAAYVFADTQNLPAVAWAQRLIVAIIGLWFILLAVNLFTYRPRRGRGKANPVPRLRASGSRRGVGLAARQAAKPRAS